MKDSTIHWKQRGIPNGVLFATRTMRIHEYLTMNPHWADKFLNHLLALDLREAPHGLYGIRRAYARDGRLPTLAHVLGSKKKSGFIHAYYPEYVRQWQLSDDLVFLDGLCVVALNISDRATTKVREFGSAYRLDSHNSKDLKESEWNLERLVLRSVGKTSDLSEKARLLVLHTASKKEVAPLLGRCGDAEFLAKYGIERRWIDWEDHFGRKIHTSLSLWVPI